MFMREWRKDKALLNRDGLDQWQATRRDGVTTLYVTRARLGHLLLYICPAQATCSRHLRLRLLRQVFHRQLDNVTLVHLLKDNLQVLWPLHPAWGPEILTVPQRFVVSRYSTSVWLSHLDTTCVFYLLFYLWSRWQPSSPNHLNEIPRSTFHSIFTSHASAPGRPFHVRSDPSLLTCFDPRDKELYGLWAPQY